MHSMMTEREAFIAALASIEISGDDAARRASEQANRLEQIGKFGRSRKWGRVHSAIEEIQRIARYDDEQLN